jgi:hypothetical protein
MQISRFDLLSPLSPLTHLQFTENKTEGDEGRAALHHVNDAHEEVTRLSLVPVKLKDGEKKSNCN